MDWKITNGSFKGIGFHVAIPKADSQFGIIDQDVNTERRLQISERPGVDGADVEDFGQKPRTFSATVVFFGGDYQASLKSLERILNEGTSGTLILPDLDEAVNAKFQRESRRTNSNDGYTTTLSLSWIEDRSQIITASSISDAQAAQAALQGGNTQDALGTVLSQSSKANEQANKALAALSLNKFLNKLSSAENAIVNARVTINSFNNLPKNQRQEILSLVGRVNGEITGLQAAINGLGNYSDSLNLGLSQTNPSRVNTGVGAVDYRSVDKVSTSVVSGSERVLVKTAVTRPVQSFQEAENLLQSSVESLSETKNLLETKTQGATSDFSTEVVTLVNLTKDLIFIIQDKPTKQVLTTAQTTLLETCFYNQIPVSDIDRIYKLNRHLDDILNIPRLTVINL